MKEERTPLVELPEQLKNCSGELFLLQGEEGKVLDLSHPLEEFLGKFSHAWKGSFFDSLFETQMSWKEIYPSLKEKGYHQAGPLRLKGPDTAVYLILHPLFIQEEEYFCAHFQASETDHSPENGSEDQRKREGEGSHFFEYLDEVVCHLAIGPDGELEPIHISPRIRELLGIGVEEYTELLRNDALSELLHPEDLPEVKRVREEFWKEKEPVSLIYRVLPKDRSSYIWIEERIYPRSDHKGDRLEYMGILRDVTEQKVVEKRLIEREKHFRKIFENSLAGVFRTLPDRTILFCNDAFVEMLGFDSQDELIGRNLEDCYYTSTDKGEFVDKVLSRDGLVGHESKVILQDGEVKHFIESVNPIKDEAGELRYIDGTIIDITALKEANRALKESKERYRALLDAAVDAIIVWEWDSGKIVNANRSASNLLKEEVEDLIDQDISSLFPKGKTDPWKELSSRFNEKREHSLINEDSSILNKKGEYLPVEVNARAFELEGHSYVIGIFRETSQWIESQQALRDSEERFRLLAGATIDGIILSKDGTIIDVNERIVEMLNYEDREDLVGMKVEDLVHPEERELARKRVRGEEGNELVETKAFRRDGSLIHVEAKGEFIPFHGQEVRVTVAHDITERKRVEDELRERERAMSTLMSNLPGIAYRCKNDPYWTMEFISEGAYELLGYRAEELIQNKECAYAELILEEDRADVWEKIQEAIKKGEAFDIQYRVRTADGSIKTFWEKGEAVGVDREGGFTILEGFITDISTRVEYEKELEKSHARYRDLIENSPYGTILHRDGEILYINDRAKQLFGLESIEDAPSRRILDYVYPEYHSMVKERMEKAKKGEVLPFVEVHGKFPDDSGRSIELEAKIDRIEYEGEEVFHTAFRDITKEKQLEKQRMRAAVAEEYNKRLEEEIEERKRTQKKLRDSQEFTRGIVESSLDMIIASDNEGRITIFNDAAQKQFGYTEEEILGEPSRILFKDPEERERVVRSIEENGGFTGEIRNRSKKGREFLTYLSATTLQDHKGDEIGAMGISRDITDIKEAEEELRKNEEKYRAIYDQAYIGIAQVDLDGYFLNVNQQFTRITGYEEGDLKGMNFQDLTVQEDLEIGEKFKEELKAKKKGRVSFEKKYIHKSGSRIELNVTVALVNDKEGEPAYFVTVFEDITERKRNEQELIRSLKEKEVLLREVHHRVKNNLQVISSILNLQSNFVEDPNTLQILRESQNRISSMSFIHESLYRTDEFDSIDLSHYIEELSSNLLRSYLKDGQDIRLERELEAVELDLDQAIPCGLIINELISNALKYAFPEGGPGVIHLAVEKGRNDEGNEEVRLTIGDNGIGIPEGYEVGESDSLGLQLVSSLIQQIGGKIRLKRDNGTSYLITFETR